MSEIFFELFSNSVLQVLRHIKFFTREITKEKIKKMMEYQQQNYPDLYKKDNFAITILLNNIFTQLNENKSDQALETLKELRKRLGKQREINYLFSGRVLRQ